MDIKLRSSIRHKGFSSILIFENLWKIDENYNEIVQSMKISRPILFSWYCRGNLVTSSVSFECFKQSQSRKPFVLIFHWKFFLTFISPSVVGLKEHKIQARRLITWKRHCSPRYHFILCRRHSWTVGTSSYREFSFHFKIRRSQDLICLLRLKAKGSLSDIRRADGIKFVRFQHFLCISKKISRKIFSFPSPTISTWNSIDGKNNFLYFVALSLSCLTFKKYNLRTISFRRTTSVSQAASRFSSFRGFCSQQR